jgi:hypothetical protein
MDRRDLQLLLRLDLTPRVGHDPPSSSRPTIAKMAKPHHRQRLGVNIHIGVQEWDRDGFDSR